MAVDRRTGLVDPFPKPLSIDTGSWPVLPELRPQEPQLVLHQWLVPVTRLPQSKVAQPGRPTCIITPGYRAGARTELVPVTRAEMLQTLLGSTFNLRPEPQRQLDVLADVVAGSSCYRLVVGSLHEAVDLIDAAVSRASGVRRTA